MNALKGLLVGTILVTAVGCSCVKKEELEAVRVEAAQARKAADEAIGAARAAEQRSQEAEVRAQRAEEAVNRGFKKSMRK